MSLTDHTYMSGAECTEYFKKYEQSLERELEMQHELDDLLADETKQLAEIEDLENDNNDLKFELEECETNYAEIYKKFAAEAKERDLLLEDLRESETTAKAALDKMTQKVQETQMEAQAQLRQVKAQLREYMDAYDSNSDNLQKLDVLEEMVDDLQNREANQLKLVQSLRQTLAEEKDAYEANITNLQRKLKEEHQDTKRIMGAALQQATGNIKDLENMSTPTSKSDMPDAGKEYAGLYGSFSPL